MDYTLAKQLKDAGFPIRSFSLGATLLNIEDNEVATISGEEMLCPPTLEELIEACGDRFHSLHLMNDGSKKWWNGHIFDEEHLNKISRSGSTPLRVMAELYLALNKNNL